MKLNADEMIAVYYNGGKTSLFCNLGELLLCEKTYAR